MDDLLALVDQFRQALLDREDVARLELANAYATLYRQLLARSAELTAQLAAARATGGRTYAKTLEQQEIQRLLDETAYLMSQFADLAEQVVSREQREAIALAQVHAETLLALGALPEQISRLPELALADLVGTLSDGSPLRGILDPLGSVVVEGVRTALIESVGRGLSAAESAKLIRTAMGGPLSRALTIARTEVLRAYRSASLRTYQANARHLDGWVWVAGVRGRTRSRTCPVCWAMHGTIHKLSEPFASHPNCRCAPAPLPRGFEPPPSGADLFAQLPVDEQAAILGKQKFARMQAGKLRLSDLVGQSRDPRWGPRRYEKPLKELMK